MPTGVYERTEKHKVILSEAQKRRYKRNPGLKRKISEFMKGNTHGFKKGNSGYWLGKKRSEETKRKISEIKKGRRCSPATEFKKGRQPYRHWLGKKFCSEHRMKISEALRGSKSSFWKGGVLRKIS